MSDRWPGEPIDAFKPCKKLKVAAGKYVPGVVIRNDYVSVPDVFETETQVYEVEASDDGVISSSSESNFSPRSQHSLVASDPAGSALAQMSASDCASVELSPVRSVKSCPAVGEAELKQGADTVDAMAVDSKATSRQWVLNLKAEWARRIASIVQSSKLHLNQLSGAWHKRWPGDSMDAYKPCKKLKVAVSKYVPQVIVMNDYVSLRDSFETVSPAPSRDVPARGEDRHAVRQTDTSSAHNDTPTSIKKGLSEKSSQRAQQRDKRAAWSKRIVELSKAARTGLHIVNVQSAWCLRWPGDTIDQYKPCKKLKDAIEKYSEDVVVDNYYVFHCSELKEPLPRGPLDDALANARMEGDFKDIRGEREYVISEFKLKRWNNWWTRYQKFIADGHRLYRCVLNCLFDDAELNSMVDGEPIPLGIWNRYEGEEWWTWQLFVHQRKAKNGAQYLCFLETGSDGYEACGRLYQDGNLWLARTTGARETFVELFRLELAGDSIVVTLPDCRFSAKRGNQFYLAGFGFTPAMAVVNAMRRALCCAHFVPNNILEAKAKSSRFEVVTSLIASILQGIVDFRLGVTGACEHDHHERKIRDTVDAVCALLDADPAIPLTDPGWKSSQALGLTWQYAMVLEDSSPWDKLACSVLRSANAKATVEQVDGNPEGPGELGNPSMPLSLWEILLCRSISYGNLADRALKTLSPWLVPKTSQYVANFLQMLHYERLAEITAATELASEAADELSFVFDGSWTELPRHRPELKLHVETASRRHWSLPQHIASLRRGDLVILNPLCLREEKVRGVIAEVYADCEERKPLRLKLCCVTVPTRLNCMASMLRSSQFTIDPLKLVSVTHERQTEAIKATGQGKFSSFHVSIRNLIVASWELSKNVIDNDITGASAAPSPQDLAREVPEGVNDEITEDRSYLDVPVSIAQRIAVYNAVRRRFSAVRGPPGTGKTHTACAMVEAWLKVSGGAKRVLVVTQSNVAALNIQERLVTLGVSCVRVGSSMSSDEMLAQQSFTQLFDEQTLEPLVEAGQRQVPLKQFVLMPLLRQAVERVPVVVMTCIASGNGNLLRGCRFCRVLIDEAAQATEPTTLVPLMSGAQGFACIGDDKQLPSTVLSQEAKRLGLEESLFERLLRLQVVDAGSGFVQLDIQHRMHSSIASFPVWRFYDEMVQNGCDDEDRPPIAGLLWPLNGDFRIYFVDCCRSSEKKIAGKSTINKREATCLMRTLDHLLRAGEGRLKPNDVAIITGYSAQRSLILNLLPPGLAKGDLRVDTVDGFQGMERDLVLVSTVRSNSAGKIGFLSDHRRTNVLLTRARRGLIIFGDSHTLANEQEIWQPWLGWLRARGGFCSSFDDFVELFQ